MLDEVMRGEVIEQELSAMIERRARQKDPEARGLYQEWADVPPPEVLERQRDGVERVVQMPDPDSLTPSPAFGPY